MKQPTKKELMEKKKKKQDLIDQRNKEKDLLNEKNKSYVNSCITAFKKVANFIQPPMGHRQRVVAQRVLLNSKNSHERCKIMEAILMSSKSDTLKECTYQFSSIVGRVEDILTTLDLPPSIFSNAIERANMLTEPDNIDANSSSNNNSANEYFEDVQSIFIDVMIQLSSNETKKLEEVKVKKAVPTLVDEKHRESMISTFHSMRTFSPERKKILEDALETLATYSQLCNVLLAIICDLSSESITMASTAEHTSDLSLEALPHIKELTRNSHMMKYTSGPKHNKIVSRLMNSKNHYDLSVALFEVVEEHATIMQDMHESKQIDGSNQTNEIVNGGNNPPSSLMSIGGTSSILGLSYHENHGHAAREKRRKETSIPKYDSEEEDENFSEDDVFAENDDDDDDEDITYIRNKNGERVPQPPKKGRGNTLFREGNNDSPKQKQIKGK